MKNVLMRMSLLPAVWLLPLLPACAAGRSAARPELRSNVLLIIADDFGNDKVGVYKEGDDRTRPKTPNIDALAADGVRFVNAYSNPVCSPTRATILTGRYGFRTGVGKNTAHFTHQLGLTLGEISIPKMLDLGGSGYDHSQVGKWHLSTNLTGGVRGPLVQGFRWSAGCPSNFNHLNCNYFWWEKQVNGELEWTTRYATTDTTDDAISRANSMSEPWCMWVSYNAPHGPLHVPPAALYHQTDPGGDDVLMYAAMVEAMDTEMGRLFESIDPTVFARTTVIFLGDNGTPGEATVPPFNSRRAKGTVYEGGVNVPFIVAGSAVPRSSRGRTSKALVNTTDIYATVADLAGVNLARVLPPALVLDSVSILPLLADPDNATIRKYAFAEKFGPNGPRPYNRRQRALRDDRWKLIQVQRHSNPRDRFEFYDLDAAEPGEDGKNLCPCPKNLDSEARAAYERLLREMEALSGP